MKTFAVGSLALLCAVAAFGDDKEAARVVRVPVTGLQAGCCDSAVQSAAGKLASAVTVTVEENKSGKWVVVTLKKDATLELSKLKEALANATEDMGKGMGTEYKLDEAALLVDASVTFRTAALSAEDKARLEKTFGAEKGFEKLAVEAAEGKQSALTLTFKKDSLISLERASKLLKDEKVEVKEVVFHGAAPAK